MSEFINIITFIRNLIISLIFGILVPYLLITYVDQNEFVFNGQLMMLNGAIYVGIYSAFGFFKKETLIRFLIGIGYIAVVVYFYTVGYTIFTIYLPHCGFGHLCYQGNVMGIEISFGYIYFTTVLLIIILKALNLLRHLVKPPEEESKYKTAILKKVGLRED